MSMCHDIHGCVLIVRKRRDGNASETQTAAFAPAPFGLLDLFGPDESPPEPVSARSTYSPRAR